MTNAFTTNDLIRFIYHEVSTEEALRIKTLMVQDPSIAAELQSMIDCLAQLDQPLMEPSETSVNIILDYSREMMELHC